MRGVRKQRVSAFGTFIDKIVDMEKVVPPVTPISDVAVTPVLNVSRKKKRS